MDKLEELKLACQFIKDNWNIIPDIFKTSIEPGGSGRPVVLLLNRQKPSIEASYDFDEERFGINIGGEFIWGFDSGCSCPSPWEDSYPDCYEKPVKTWKEFVVNIDKFDSDMVEDCLEQFYIIKKSLI